MVQLWLQNQCVQEAVRRGLEVSIVVVGQTQIHNRPHVVRSQVDCQLVRSDAFMGLEKLRTRGSVLVPERVVQWLLFYRSGKVLLRLGEVSLKELKSA